MSGSVSNLPSQQDAIATALALFPSRPFAVSDIGSQTGWLKAAGHDPRNLYVSGPMGLATSVALGLAAVRPNDLLAAMNRIRPHFFHFSGHGNGGAIYLLDDDNYARAVSKTQLGDLFKLYRKDIACVFLNACYGAQQAEAISQHIPKVIGTTAAIPDSVAIQYATLFYQAIGEGGDIEYAFEYAKMSVGMNGMMGPGPSLTGRPATRSAAFT